MMGPAPFCVMSPVVKWRWSQHHLHLPLSGTILAINLIEHDITQKLDLEATLVAIVSSYQ